jgi:hypothetical protein
MLDVDKTHAGKIYKEVFLRTKEYTSELQKQRFGSDELKDTLARIEKGQRIRLKVLSHLLPRDWDWYFREY